MEGITHGQSRGQGQRKSDWREGKEPLVLCASKTAVQTPKEVTQECVERPGPSTMNQ